MVFAAKPPGTGDSRLWSTVSKIAVCAGWGFFDCVVVGCFDFGLFLVIFILALLSGNLRTIGEENKKIPLKIVNSRKQ